MLVCPQCNLKYPNGSAHCFVDGTALEKLEDARLGTTVGGRYVLEEILGEGGMATVYRAHHRLVERRCAIKIMNQKFAKDEVLRERFRREAKSAQKLAHVNIIEIFDHGELQDGTVYLVMELLRGETLADVLDYGAVPIERTLPVGIQIARGLARAHDLEVIHRDLKPENIYLAKDEDGNDVVKLLDFGIARSMSDTRLTGMGEVFGTPQYMAPERISSIDAGPSADLYSLGVILFEMLTGQLPWHADSVPDWFVKHMKEPPPPARSIDPSIPEELDKLILDLLAKRAEKRPVDAHRVHADLTRIAGALGLRPLPEPESIQSQTTEARTLPPAAIDAWARRTALFDEMLRTAYPGGPPEKLSQQLGEVKGLVQEISALRARGLDEQRALQTVEQRGRDARQRLNHAVDALGVDASKARDSLRAALAAHVALQTQVELVRSRAFRAQKDVLLWEGRSGRMEPYTELSEAYRSAAAAVDKWYAVRQQEKQAEARVQKVREAVNDLQFQIQQLRSALAQNEERTDRDARSKQDAVADLGQRADELETKLMELASTFCGPLRAKPELGLLFRELEADAAA